jgi:hypothetical protein
MNGNRQESISIIDSVDYRLVAFGSLLPDMVDRGIRAALPNKRFSPHQHLLGHTLLLNAPLIAAGIGLAARQRDSRLLAVSGAALTHLLVDPVMRSPGTLLWPMLGLTFPEARGLNRPLTALTQIAAASLVLATMIGLQRKGRLKSLVTSGRL